MLPLGQYAFAMRVNESFSFPGYFWPPGAEDKKIPGNLRVLDGGAVDVDFLGNMDGETFDPLLLTSDAPNRIIGLVEKHGYVTLENCSYRSKNTSLFGGVSKSTVTASHLLIGCHLDQKELFAFNEFRFSVDGLEEWLSVGAIRITYSDDGVGATINFGLPPMKSVDGNFNGFSLSFDFGGSLPGLNPKQAQVTLKAFVRVRSETLRSFTDFVEIAYQTIQFMRLVLGEKLSICEAFVTRDDLKHDFSNGKQPNIQLPVFYQSLPFDPKVPEIKTYRMLFLFPPAEHRFAQMLRNWFTMYELFSPALGLYFSAFADQHKYLDQRFLSLVQALETLHRRTTARYRLPREEYKTLKAKLIENCPEAHKDWLSQRLNFANEIFLVDRLKELITPFEVLLGDADSIDRMTTKMKHTRNYLTHFDPSLKAKAAKGRDLWLLCERAEALFCLHLLHRIGLTQEELATVAKSENHIKDGLAAQ